MRRRDRGTTRNLTWNSWINDDGTWPLVEVEQALLMDIRDELRALNSKLAGVGPTVHAIERNTRRITCRRCRRGPFISYRGLNQHVRQAHAA